MTSAEPPSLRMAYKKARRQYLKTTRNRDNDIDQDWTPFRAAEKYYKARFPPPDLSSVLDLANAGSCSDVDYQTTKLKDLDCKRTAYIIPRIPGAVFCRFYEYQFSIKPPGLVLLPSFVSSEKQRQLVRWSLSDHAKYPNETNLDMHYIIPQDGLWNTYLKSRTDTTRDLFIQPRASTSEDISSASDRSEPGPRKLIENTPATPSNFELISTSPKSPPAPSPTVQPRLTSALLRKLRWANIGWYYHWGSKQYDFSKGKGDICSEVRQLCKSAVGVVDWEDVFSGPAGDLEWGKSGPDWKTWNDTYGSLFTRPIYCSLLTIISPRT
jgi:alkylated DNA repair protein alkB family protein 1